MSIQVNDAIPEMSVKIVNDQITDDVATSTLFANKTTLLFAVPGAFTPGCSNTHLPGYIELYDQFIGKGVDQIVCMSVNDAFVMATWADAQQVGAIKMLADGSAELAKAMGLEMDCSGWSMGMRSKRFAMLINNGIVTDLAVEPAGGIDVSAAGSMLEKM